MELEELKTAWLSLDAKLENSNKINERIIKDTLQNKSKKSLNRLTNLEVLGVILVFAALPFLIFISDRMLQTTASTILKYFTLAMLIIACVTQPIKVLMLIKIDLSKVLSSNIKQIQRYNLFIKRETIIVYIITLPIFFILIVATFISFGKIVEAWRWAAVIALFPLTAILCIWQYKKIYAPNIQSIQNSLEELRDMEEKE